MLEALHFHKQTPSFTFKAVSSHRCLFIILQCRAMTDSTMVTPSQTGVAASWRRRGSSAGRRAVHQRSAGRVAATRRTNGNFVFLPLNSMLHIQYSLLYVTHDAGNKSLNYGDKYQQLSTRSNISFGALFRLNQTLTFKIYILCQTLTQGVSSYTNHTHHELNTATVAGVEFTARLICRAFK